MIRKILIVDSSSVIAMRVKVLLELIGCEVELIHFSMLDMYTNIGDYDLVVVAHGVPVGGELEYVDAGTLTQAFSGRRPL